MKADLDHLPERKKRDLERIVEILFAEFEDATALATQSWKKQGRILKVILYGSYARGDWVADPKGGYYSDYDILVVVNDDRLTDPIDYWYKAEDHFLREYAITKRLSAPVGLIVHSLGDVNFQLSRGRPFFIDIVRDGIVLYELGTQSFDPPKPLSPAVAREEAQGYFETWFARGAAFLRNAGYAVKDGDNSLAAFLLHQATEHFYHAVLHVLTLYSPKSHKINFLRDRAEDIARDLIPVWPRDEKFARRCFELLQQAYVNARYSPHYKISDDELAWLVERIERLQTEVKTIAERHLAEKLAS
ncbi:HEPN domain-containing protein [Sphingopyxis terrae]|uniref:HEPN domain-containing protein n=1 Tax=Sphingopyxis terrae subsp. ummariensis TaxID=429001 RepID=A0A1Y6FN04_9SPHN|nr:HEPN domain-containing protein [Sphingopyxis terrae]PCF90988.1 nucleotidyltransferase [Sphingopyxis terrae subsp. ummariensis]SMQ76394.1 HEPN domain-containing protein [Sphingopyxis terrae subsp. ummariensis]